MSTPGSRSRRAARHFLWNALIFALIFHCQVQDARAGSIPFQEAWTYDGPQPHGPGGGLLVDHQPYNNGGFASDTMAFQSPGGAIVSQLVADDFVIPSDSEIRRVIFWGYYSAGIEPVANEAFRISFFDARPTDGLPGAILSQTSVQGIEREWTGRVILISGNPREYRFAVDLPAAFPILGGQKYWMSINQTDDPASSFEWEICATADFNGLAIQNSNYPHWLYTATVNFLGDSAFQLLSIPEPTVGGLLAFGLFVLGCRRCGRRQSAMNAIGFLVTTALVLAPDRAAAGSIPFQEAWTYDGPQPHGPGAPLVDHPPHRFGGLTSDSMGFGSPGGSIVYQFVADDFALPFDVSIGRIVFLGFYNSQILPIGDETFQINIHQPRAGDGLPGDVIFSQTVINPFREWTGHNVIASNGGREYRFVVDLATPLPLAGGETNWLSIYQVGDPNSSFRWEASVAPLPPNGSAAQNEVFPNWTPYEPTNHAFQLYSIPEPSSAILVAIGIMLIVMPRRRVLTGVLALVIVAGMLSPSRVDAGSIPFQESWTYDGPQPHGPGTPLVSHLPHSFCGLTSDSVGFEEPGQSL